MFIDERLTGAGRGRAASWLPLLAGGALLSAFCAPVGMAAPAAPEVGPLPSASRATVDAVLSDLVLDDTQGRNNLTPGGALARERLTDWLLELGATPAGEDASYEQVFPQGINLLAIYYPRGTEGQPPQVLIGAHYDHVGTSCKARVEAASSICNGAADDGGGVAAAVAAFEALRGEVSVPVGLALWDAEEDGKVGSEFFAANPTFRTEALRLYINFDIVGLNLFRGAEDLHFALGAESGGPELIADVDAVLSSIPLGADRLSYVFGVGRSDTDSFVTADYPLPFVFFTDGDGSVYHTTADELAYLNVDKVEAVATATVRLALRAIEGDGYTYTAPEPANMAPTFHDAEVVLGAMQDLLRDAVRNQLTAEQVRQVTYHIAALKVAVSRGEQRFGVKEGAQVFSAVLVMLQISNTLPFVP